MTPGLETIAEYLRDHDNVMPTSGFTIVKCRVCGKSCIRIGNSKPLQCTTCINISKPTGTIETRKCANPHCQKTIVTSNTNVLYCSTSCKPKPKRKPSTASVVKKVLTEEELKEKEKKSFYKALSKATLAVEIAQRQVYGQGDQEGKAALKMSGEHKKLSKELVSLSRKEYNDKLEEEWKPYNKE